MPSSAIQQATQLERIEFPEFTNQLIDDVYSTIVDSQIEQTEAFIDLVRQTSKPLAVYVRDTVAEVSGEEILALILRFFPGFDPTADDLLAEVAALGSDDLAAFRSATQVSGVADPLGETPGDFDSAIKTTITPDELSTAAANKVASDRHRLLTEMIRTGLVRLVVRDGEIETGLRFQTNSVSSIETTSRSSSRRQKGFNANVGFFGKVFGIRASARSSRIDVSTRVISTTNVANTSVDIGGRVFIKFKSDFQPLGNPLG